MPIADTRGGFALAAWCGARTCERWAKETLNVTIRCLPFDQSIARRWLGMCYLRKAWKHRCSFREELLSFKSIQRVA
ncbi:hypothetical protein [Caballeronia sp. SEWSISQ10-4 2]|uniref:hypothetical protein n=1 Tax=Caballeronia sp. SEWSISQ10-4 2 TaxID=2937438 RepID=UPI003462C890